MTESTPGVDIAYASTDGHSDVVFTALTAKGHEWMGADTLTLSMSEAAEYLQQAKDAKMVIVSLAG